MYDGGGGSVLLNVNSSFQNAKADDGDVKNASKLPPPPPPPMAGYGPRPLPPMMGMPRFPMLPPMMPTGGKGPRKYPALACTRQC